MYIRELAFFYFLGCDLKVKVSKLIIETRIGLNKTFNFHIKMPYNLPLSVKDMDCSIVVNGFELRLRYCHSFN